MDCGYYGFSYSLDPGIVLMLLDFISLGVQNLCYLNKKENLNVVLNKPFNCALIELDNYFVFGIGSCFDYGLGGFTSPWRVVGDKLSESLMRKFIKDVSGFHIDNFLYLKRDVLLQNMPSLVKVVNQPSLKRRTGELYKEGNKCIADEIKRSAQEYFDFLVLGENIRKGF